MTRTRRSISAASALCAVFALGACSSVPDAANPAHWYRNTVDYFAGDDAEAAKKKAQEAERQKQRAQAQAKASAQAESAPAKRDAETDEVAERLARPANRGLLADTGSRARYATAVPRQAEDPGAPPSRAQQAAKPAADEPPPAPAPRPAVAASPPPPAPPPAARAPAAPPPAAPPPPAPARAQTPAPSPTPPSAPARAQPAPAPAPVASPPPPAAEPPQPAVTTRALTVEETYRASLAEQNRLPSATAAGSIEPPDTLIVSSEGLETVRRTPPSRAGAASPAVPARQAAAGRTPGVLGGIAALRPAGQVDGAADSPALKVATIQFADGSARLDEEARRVIGQVAKLQAEKGGKLRVVGHASMRTKPMDPDRHAKVNEGISIARANAVAGQLARLGVKRDAIVVDARGDAAPAYYEIMETGEAGNRRAEIYLEANP